VLAACKARVRFISLAWRFSDRPDHSRARSMSIGDFTIDIPHSSPALLR
jgi:hypothetical protein